MKQNLVKLPQSVTILNRLQDELNKMVPVSESAYKTKNVVEGFHKAIMNEMSIETLIKMHGSIMARKSIYNESHEILQKKSGIPISVSPFMISGNSPSDYEDDIITRIKVLTEKGRRETVESLIKEAQEFISKEDRMANFMVKLTESNIQI